MRKPSIVLSAFVLALFVASAAGAAGWWKDSPADRHAVRSAAGDYTKSLTTWGPIGGWGPSDGLILDAKGAISVTWSIEVSGAPGEFRIGLAKLPATTAPVMPPGAIHVDPAGGTIATSFTFVKSLTAGTYEMTLWWRSPTGEQVSMSRFSVDVLYTES
jgi:hypothetical protein